MREVTRTHKGIYGYIEKNNRVMLIIKKRGPYTGMYDLPGGSQEIGETEAETLKREINEETGCNLIKYTNRREETVRFENFIEDDGREGCLIHTGILFKCEIDGTPDISISDLDSDGAFWISKENLNEEIATPLVLFCLNYYG
jgi:ADP-ribose pyrophosphatase YjhB (NUDIX family)